VAKSPSGKLVSITVNVVAQDGKLTVKRSARQLVNP